MITCRTLTDGGQSAVEVAGEVADVRRESQRSLDLALYDIKLDGESETLVVAAIRRRRRVASPSGWRTTSTTRIRYPCRRRRSAPRKTSRRCRSLHVPSPAFPTSCTTSSPSETARQCSPVPRTGPTIRGRGRRTSCSSSSPELSEAYALAFEQLWSGRPVLEAGRVEPRPVDVGETARAAVVLSRIRRCALPPGGQGDRAGTRRVRICSPVISAGPVLGTLAQVAGRRPAWTSQGAWTRHRSRTSTGSGRR